MAAPARLCRAQGHHGGTGRRTRRRAERQILEGPMGFYHALTGSIDVARSVAHGLGDDWQIAEATVKPYPVCAILQGPVGTIIALSKEHRLTLDGVEEIRLELKSVRSELSRHGQCRTLCHAHRDLDERRVLHGAGAVRPARRY